VSHLLIISGPTASGKTDLSVQIAHGLSKTRRAETRRAEIINADVGQFYTKLSVGTAKPDWKKMPVPHHLFDVLDEPKDLNVCEYRKMVLEKTKEIWKRGNLPIVVGGSLFYIKSLFFPPLESSEKTSEGKGASDKPFHRLSCKEGGEEETWWAKLNAIDPKRAEQIHPNDTYRIKRAIAIWKKTGKKPSEFEPVMAPEFTATMIFINLPREELFKRIDQRTKEMIESGDWSREARNIMNSEWSDFLKTKKLIGYPEIFDWIENGCREENLPRLVRDIQTKTRHYAKRQVTFWKKFRKILCDTKIFDLSKIDEKSIKNVIESVEDDFLIQKRDS